MRAGLPFPDALDLRCMHGVKFVLVAGLLGEDSFSAFKNLPEGPFKLRVPGDLAPDVADQAAKPGAQAPNPSQTLFMTARIDQAASRPARVATRRKDWRSVTP